MNESIRELTADELGAVSGGLGGLLGQIKDLLTGNEKHEKSEHEGGLIEKIERLVGIK